MIGMDEAENLMKVFLKLKKIANETKSEKDLNALRKHETLCIEKFDYLVKMRTNRYKAFPNYDDLNQEGTEALLRAMKTYNPKKGNFFAWAHNYISTRIYRSASLHSAMRVPLRIAKTQPPHKETVFPVVIEEQFCPDKLAERSEVIQAVRNTVSLLSKEQQEIVTLAFGFNGDKPMSINKICKKFNITRSTCLKTIRIALSTLKDNIKI